ncbi:MAG TPA: hypothetical protein V6C91_12425 [Coleofasciculaceae cyanobacterium]
MNDFRLQTLKPHYQQLFANCKIRSSWLPKLEETTHRIISLRSRYYDAIAVSTTVPWWFVGILHYRESGFRDVHLHNGDPLTNRTVRPPADRPFAAPANGFAYSFVESGVDALRWKSFDTAKDRSIEAWLWRFELWNGFEYAQRGLNSEYLWNGTNHFGSGNNRGKIFADGRFDPNAQSEQVGAAAIVWYMLHKGILDSGVQQPVESQGNSFSNLSMSFSNYAGNDGFGQVPIEPVGVGQVSSPAMNFGLQEQASIELLDVFRYYQKLPHQDAAIAWLQQQQSASVLAEFARRWRVASANRGPAPLPQPVAMGTSTLPMEQVSRVSNGATSVMAPAPQATVVKPKPRNLEERIIAYCEEKGYQINRGVGEKNIIYVEGMYPDGTLNDDAPFIWNDTRMVIEFFDGVPKIIGRWEATTEPGRYYTMRPMNINGAARIAFGQHRAWQVGTHSPGGAHEALIQTGGPVTVHRDLNKDGARTGDRTERGHFGINQHWGGDSPKSDIGRWSAGCLVGRTRDGHREFMKIVKQDSRYLKNKGHVFSVIVIPGDDLFAKFPPS